MKRIFRSVFLPQGSVGFAAIILMSTVFLSRLLGLFRDRLLAAWFPPEELGVYFAAFRLPNLLFELLVMGAFTTTFIPVFMKYIVHDRKKEAFEMSATLINGSVILLSLLCIPIMIWIRPISEFFAPGFSSSQIDLMVSFTRLMLMFQVLPLMIGNFLTGILQSYKYFFISAFAPVVYNIGIILSIVFLAPTLKLYAPVFGVGIGAVFFMGIQLPYLITIGYKHKFIINLKEKGVKEVLALTLPRTLGLAVSQIDTTVDLILASTMGAKMVTIFNFAQHLQYVPIGLFGATVAQAMLPTLSQTLAKKDKDHFYTSLFNATRQVSFFLFPISVLFIVLRIPLVRIVFGADRFDWEATVLTGKTLSAFGISLVAQGMVQILARGYYALYNSRTPVITGIISVLINTILSIVFVFILHMPVWSLGVSASIASIFNSFILIILLLRQSNRIWKATLFWSMVKMFFASACMGITVYIPLKLFDVLLFDTTRIIGLLFLTTFSASIGLCVYIFISWILGIEELSAYRSLFMRLQKKLFIFETAREVVSNGGENVT